MSPAYERRLARIDKAFDRIRADGDAEEARLGLAEFYFNCAIVDWVTREHGPEAAMWVLGGPPTPLGFHHKDTKKDFDAEDAKVCAEDAEGSCRGEAAINHHEAETVRLDDQYLTASPPLCELDNATRRLSAASASSANTSASSASKE